MRVAIDWTPMQTEHRFRGIGYFTENLVKNVVKLSPEDEYILVGYAGGELAGLPSGNVRYEGVMPKYPIVRLQEFWEIMRLRKQIEKLSPDIFFSAQNLLFTTKKRNYGMVAMLHDVFPLTFRDSYYRFYTWDKMVLYREKVRRIRYADALIANSEFTKKIFVEQFSVPSTKVYVVHQAHDASFRIIRKEDVIERAKRAYGINSKYILNISGGGPNKNLPRLIRAFIMAASSLPEDVSLVIGGQIRRRKELEKVIESCGGHGRVLITGFISQDDLPALMNGAILFILPSLYEGFGIPILQAMACGTPVITSGTSALVETAGSAAEFVDPYKMEGISRSIVELVENEGRRTELTRRGLERAKQYSWERCARQVLEVYRTVAMERADKGGGLCRGKGKK